MLPAYYQTVKRRAFAGVLALALAVPMGGPALALDRHDRGVVAGALGMLFIQGMIKASKTPPQPAPVYAAPAPVYVPAPVYAAPVYAAPVYAAQPVAATRTPAAYAFGSYSGGERRAIQRSLARAGYYYGPIDGAFGRGTYMAAASFARDTGSAAEINTQAGAYGVFDRLLYGAN